MVRRRRGHSEEAVLKILLLVFFLPGSLLAFAFSFAFALAFAFRSLVPLLFAFPVLFGGLLCFIRLVTFHQKIRPELGGLL